MKVKLRMTGRQHGALYNHLFPGDGKEAIAFALCGVRNGSISMIASVFKLIPVPYDLCLIREEDQIKWPSDLLPPLLQEAEKKGLILLKIHSHPTGFPHFSKTDDFSDNSLFPRVSEWTGASFSGISAIMLPDKSIIARAFFEDSQPLSVESIMVAGSDIQFWKHSMLNNIDIDDEVSKRTKQAFGGGTLRILQSMKVGVIGISGTGSPVVEQLYRLGVGSLLLVDGDIVKKHNVGRIYNSSLDDATEQRKKVDVLHDAIVRSRMKTEVEVIGKSILNHDVLLRLAECDVLFGCMDSIEGRDILNRLSVFYSIPYFDLGVQLNADEENGISGIYGAIHYLQPDGFPLMSRGVYNPEKLRVESLKRTNPTQYASELKEGYIKGIQEDNPAVISVNTMVSSFAVNDFLCRIHADARADGNENVDCIRISWTNNHISFEKEESRGHSFVAKYAGRGDMRPFLDMLLVEEKT